MEIVVTVHITDARKMAREKVKLYTERHEKFTEQYEQALEIYLKDLEAYNARPWWRKGASPGHPWYSSHLRDAAERAEKFRVIFDAHSEPFFYLNADDAEFLFR